MRISTRSSLVRIGAALAAVTLATLVAAGCGAGGSDDPGASGVLGDAGPLAWMPKDTWLVATTNLDPAVIDTAVTTLDRLPIWALAEGFLPARDGKGLRRELLEELAKESTTSGEDKPKVSAKELERAFGHRAGIAITGTDFESLDQDTGPVMAWVEVDDEDAALAAAKDLIAGSHDEVEHEGVTYYDTSSDDVTFLVRDGLLVVSTTTEHMEALIETREGDDSLADDETAAAILEVGVGEALGGFALASEPLLEAAPRLVREQAERVADDEDATRSEQQEAERMARIADELGPLLESNAVDGMIPDWIGGSMTIDESGLRMRGVWSNPRELADPEPGSRELVERMPADAQIVNAYAQDGTMLRRVQEAWAEVRDAYDLDLRQLVAGECSQADRWACDLGIELALTMLEDEQLADALAEQGDTVSASVQDIGPQLGALAELGETGRATSGALDERVMEFVLPADANLEGYEPPSELADAMQRAGLEVTTQDGGDEVTIRVRPNSPLRRVLVEEFDQATLAALAAVGFDLRGLLTAEGLTLREEQVDDLGVWGVPPDAPSTVAPALRGDVDTLADNDVYEEIVAAANPPEQVGAYGWIDLKGYVEETLTMLSTDTPEVKRVIPTVRNNLADVPGVLTWTAREESGGEQVGVYELSVPILE
jgi:hypothetical protein